MRTLNSSEFKLKASIRKNITSSIGTQFSYAFGQWLITILIIKALGTESLGIFGYMFAVIAPCFAFANFGLRSLLATEKDIKNISKSLNFRLITTFIAAILIFIYSLFDKAIQTNLFIPVILYKVIEAIDDYFRGILQYQEKFQTIFNSNFLFTIFSVLSAAIFLLLLKNLELVLWGYLFAKAIAFLYLLRNLPNKKMLLTKSENKTEAQSYFLLGLPLAISALLVAFNSNIPKYFIQHMLNSEYLGIYLALFFFITAGANLFVALKNALAPRFSQMWHTQPHSFHQNIIKIQVATLSLVFSAAIVAYFFGGQILQVFYTSDYINHGPTFSLLLIGGAFMFAQSFASLGLTIIRATNSQPIIASLALIINAISCYILIPRYEFIGACLAFLIGSSIFFFGSNFYLFLSLKKKTNQGSV